MHYTLARCLRQKSDTEYAISILPAMIAMPLPAVGREGQRGRGVRSSRETKGTHTSEDIRPLGSSAVLRRDKGERRFVRREIGFCG